MRTAVALTLAAGSACYAPTYQDPKCGPGGACPPGYHCVGSACVPDTDAQDPDAPHRDPIDADPASDASSPDAPIDQRRCAVDAPFGRAELVAGVNGWINLYGATLSPDELTIYVSTANGAIDHIYVATRSSTEEPFGTPRLLDQGSPDEIIGGRPTISDDGLTLFFYAIPDGNGEIFWTQRTATDQPFGQPYAVGAPIDTAADETDPFLSPNDLYFVRDAQIYRGGKPNGPVVIGNLPTPPNVSPALSRDDRELFFSHHGDLGWEIWVARRSSTGRPFEAPQLVPDLTEVSSGIVNFPQWVSPDGCRVYFSSNRPGKERLRLWQASRSP